MICSSCLSKTIMGAFERDILVNSPRDYNYINNTFLSLEETIPDSCKCKECERPFGSDEIGYDEKVIKKKVIDSVGELLTSKIECCDQCGTGAIFDEYSRSLRKSCDDEEELEEAEEELSRLESSESIMDLINDYFSYDPWEEYQPSIVHKIYCPQCGIGRGDVYDDKRDYGEFELCSEVYTKEGIDKFNQKFYGDEEESIDKIVENIANEFDLSTIRKMTEDYLSNALGFHPLIKKMERYIKELFDDGFQFDIIEDRIIYRARANGKGTRFCESEMWEPPIGVSSQGRYNEKGVSVLYCSNCIDAVKLEVPNKGAGYTIGKFIIKQPMKLFPINRVFDGEYATFVISNNNNVTAKGKKSYILTNLVSAICRNVGYDGVVYTSVKDDKYVNYAFFCKYMRGKELDCIDTIVE